MTRNRSSWTAAVLAVVLCTAAAAEEGNLLLNPSFDHDISGWEVTADELAVGWSGLDASGGSLSGSLRVVNNAPTDIGYPAARLCVPVVVGEVYDMRGSFFYPDGQPHPGWGSVFAYAYPSVDCSGFSLAVSTEVGILNGDAWTTLETRIAIPAGSLSVLVLFGFRKAGDGGEGVFHLDDAFFGPAGTACVATATALCLVGDRYRVEADWRTATGSGQGRAVEINDGPASGTGYFWFFEDANVEVVVKVLDACVAPFDRVWVFAGGLTDQEVELRVTDSFTGETWSHFNPLGNVWDTVTDTTALDVCE